MSDPRDTSWPDGQGRALDGAGRELASALADARERMPDDVTMRRMWERARVAQPELAVAPLPSRTPRWIWFAGGVASTAALAFAFVAWAWHGKDRELAKAPGKSTPTTLVAAAATPEPPAMPAPEGTVRTGAGERLALALAGGAEARLGSSSVLTVAHDGHAVVDGGEVSFTVTRREHARPYVVMAGPYRVVVLGARFRLSLDETKRVHVDAEDGVAEVWDQGRVARLGAGESWTSPAAAPAAPAPAPHAHALATPRTDDAADPEARAQAALAAGDVTRALGMYRALAKRGGPASENAAYEVGKLLRDRLGQPASAVAAWRRYRADHPEGILRVETDVSIIETLVHAGDAGGALGEANDFLRNHPDSERRAEIARIAGDLYRVRGDLPRAVAAYQIALASSKARDAEPATFHRAECLVRLGDPSGEEAARDYLRRWPEGRFRADAQRLLTGGDVDGAARL